MKRLALFMDGTWNKAESNTNVWEMYRSVLPEDARSNRQLRKHIDGVGDRWFNRLRGGAVGYGLSAKVLEGYQWLVDHYDDGDEVYLFGFSRGAFTARSIGGLIKTCGLLRRDSAMTVADIFKRYRAGKDAASILAIERASRGGRLDAADRRLLDSSRRVEIEMIGVWDTVGSLGVPWTAVPWIGRGNFFFHNTYPSELYRHMVQAVAVDEHRGPYKPTLWTRFVPDSEAHAVPASRLPDVEQRWFAGAHCNVGGGYHGNALSDLPLHWMQQKAIANGLACQAVAVPPDAFQDEVKDSYREFMRGVYRFLPFTSRTPREIGALPRKVKGGWSIPVNETIDPSVVRRFQIDPAYRPRNLLDFARARGIDLANADPNAMIVASPAIAVGDSLADRARGGRTSIPPKPRPARPARQRGTGAVAGSAGRATRVQPHA
jgi:hypothetical protein